MTGEAADALDPARSAIDSMFDRPADQGVSFATVVMHRGLVVAERYGVEPATVFSHSRPVTSTSALVSWSVAKSVLHAAVGILVGDGAIDPDAPAPVPDWVGTDKEAITLTDLLEMRSGLRFVEDYVDGETSHCLAMLFGDGAADHAAYAAALPLDHRPGTVWNYSSGSSNIISAVLSGVVGSGPSGIGEFLTDRLFGPMGCSPVTLGFDGAGNWVGSSYVHATAIDFARFGELYRCDGVTTSGERILPPGWVDEARTIVARDPDGFAYGRHWWVWPRYHGSLAAHGYDGQFVVVVPDRELVVAHLGKTPAEQRPLLVDHLTSIIDAFPVVGSGCDQ